MLAQLTNVIVAIYFSFIDEREMGREEDDLSPKGSKPGILRLGGVVRVF